MIHFWIRIGLAFTAVIAVGLLFTFERPPVQVVQSGYRGIGLEQVYNRVALENQIARTVFPAEQPEIDPAGILSSEVYENVQVLGDVDANEFIRLMGAITEWVSPEQGCAYCHSEEEAFSDDSLYTKRVARRMLEMTRAINAQWADHVGATGVNCYTCHAGNPVPAEIWFTEPENPQNFRMVGSDAGQNRAGEQVGLSSLPSDPFSPFFISQPADIRVIGDTALPTGNRRSIKQTEWTYGLMIHMSDALGVNCVFCHNSRAFSDWSQSGPQRTTAWYGIAMVRDLNANYLVPLRDEYPHERLGVLGDAPKANCATCHQGAYKPLFGHPAIEGFPDLVGPVAETAVVQ
jgi:photosynthetic reaction center cytochrome c subunit